MAVHDKDLEASEALPKAPQGTNPSPLRSPGAASAQVIGRCQGIHHPHFLPGLGHGRSKLNLNSQRAVVPAFRAR